MEKQRDGDILSPNAAAAATTSSSSSNSGGGGGGSNGVFPASAAPAPSPVSAAPKSIPRSIDPNPYPTTFIQADTCSFKHVVQMLTGSAETAAKHVLNTPPPPLAAPKNHIPPSARATCPKKPAFKLYERRSSMKNLKMISPLIPSFAATSSPNTPIAGFTQRKQQEILSPSILDLPSLVISPVTPLISDPFDRSPEPGSAEAVKAEERAIAEKSFYFHPSPRNAEPPRLLPLFPVTTGNRVSSASSFSSLCAEGD